MVSSIVLAILKHEDIESNLHLIGVEEGKGNKDRFRLLSDKLYKKLKIYKNRYHLKVNLFYPTGNSHKSIFKLLIFKIFTIFTKV